MKPMSLKVLGLLGLATLFSSGCSLCCSPYLDDYVTYGSRTPRSDMKQGRVGSILSDPQSMGASHAIQAGEEYDEVQSQIRSADSVGSVERVGNEAVSIGKRNPDRQ